MVKNKTKWELEGCYRTQKSRRRWIAFDKRDRERWDLPERQYKNKYEEKESRMMNHDEMGFPYCAYYKNNRKR